MLQVIGGALMCFDYAFSGPDQVRVERILAWNQLLWFEYSDW